MKCGRETPACVRCIRGGYGDKCLYVAYDDGLPTPTDDSPDHRREGSTGHESWTEEAESWQRSAATKPVNENGNMDSITAQFNPRKRPVAQRSIEELRERVVELETYVRAAGSRPVSSEKLFGLGHVSMSDSLFDASSLGCMAFYPSRYGKCRLVSDSPSQMKLGGTPWRSCSFASTSADHCYSLLELAMAPSRMLWVNMRDRSFGASHSRRSTLALHIRPAYCFSSRTLQASLGIYLSGCLISTR